jgi:cytochrome P450
VSGTSRCPVTGSGGPSKPGLSGTRPGQKAPASSTRSALTTLPALRSALKLRFRPLEFLDSLSGQGRVIRLRLGRHRVYLLNDAKLVREVLVLRGQQAPKTGVMFDNAREFLGNGLITSNGKFHIRQRRLMQPAFRPARIATYATIMSQAIDEWTGSWPGGREIQLHEELLELTQTIASRSLFSMDPTGHMVDEISRCVCVLEEGVGKRTLMPIDLLYRLPTPGNRAYRRAVERLDRLIDDIIAAYRRSGVDHGDLLSMLLSAQDEESGERMSDEQVHDECLSLFMASVETTARAMSWALYVLARHPQVEERVHHEVDAVLDGRPAGYDDINDLPYLRRVVTETMRLYPPAWLLPRKAVTDLELGGHRIPAGSDIFSSTYLVHHDPEVYPEPDRFDPDRWLPEHAARIPRGSYIPFGAGARQCIGNDFAVTEIMLLLATLTNRWHLEPVPGQRVQAKAMTVLSPQPLSMIARRRTRGGSS